MDRQQGLILMPILAVRWTFYLLLFQLFVFQQYMRAPLKVKTDYLNILLDLAAQRTRERGDRAYERVLGMPLRDVRLLRMIGTQPGISMGALSDGSGLEKTLASKVIGSLVKGAGRAPDWPQGRPQRPT